MYVATVYSLCTVAECPRAWHRLKREECFSLISSLSNELILMEWDNPQLGTVVPRDSVGGLDLGGDVADDATGRAQNGQSRSTTC